MSKENISASVDPEVAAHLSRDEVNASGLINSLVKKQMAGGTSERAMVELRLEQVESEIEQTESRLETLTAERDQLQARLDDIDDKATSELAEARENLDGVPRDPENPAIVNWATKLDMTPEQLLEEL